MEIILFPNLTVSRIFLTYCKSNSDQLLGSIVVLCKSVGFYKMFYVISTSYTAKTHHETYFFPHNMKWIAIQITLAGIKAVNIILIICEQFDFLGVGKNILSKIFWQFEGCWFASLIF